MAIIVEVAVIAGLIFLPWAIRDWLVFGSPLPGQAVANALAVNGTDVFAWNDPPTLSRYLAVGPIGLIGMRIGGIVHNLFNVLLLPGLPISVIGLVGLYWTVRSQALRPVVIVSFTAFIVTSLVFPVATTWGTFLHASGPFQVLLVVSALFLLDGLIEEISIRRKWTNPNAWLGAVLGIFGSLLFSIVLLPSFAADRATPRGCTRSSGNAWRPSAIRSIRRTARSSRTTRSGWRRRRASMRSACPMSHRVTSSTLQRTSARPC